MNETLHTVGLAPSACNLWHHVAGVRDGQLLKLFVDGTFIGQRDMGSNYDLRSRVPFTIGAGADSGSPGNVANFGGDFGFLAGYIDEARLSEFLLIPEPASLAMVVFAAPLLGRRRPRRRA